MKTPNKPLLLIAGRRREFKTVGGFALWLAKKTECRYATMYSVIYGQKASMKLCARIIWALDGKIRMEELRPDVYNSIEAIKLIQKEGV